MTCEKDKILFFEQNNDFVNIFAFKLEEGTLCFVNYVCPYVVKGVSDTLYQIYKCYYINSCVIPYFFLIDFVKIW